MQDSILSEFCSFFGRIKEIIISFGDLVDARIRCSDKDLPVPVKIVVQGSSKIND